MLKRVQHDKKKYFIPNLFRNLEFGHDNKSIAFALIIFNHVIASNEGVQILNASAIPV